MNRLGGIDLHFDFPCDPRNYKKGRSQAITFLVIHYVGATGGAKNNAVYYGREQVPASAHYFVGHASERAAVYQSVLDGDTAWHCGTTGKYRHPTCRNANSLGIEICCHKDAAGVWYFDRETVDKAVELARALMAKHNIGIANVVRHYDVTGKNCPAPFVESPEAWAQFKARLTAPEKEEDTEMPIYKTLTDVPESYRPTIEKLMKSKALGGYSDPDPTKLTDNVINVDETYCRVMTTLNRMGKLD